jgi:tRNA(fMet)-specific endonuclease VapC
MNLLLDTNIVLQIVRAKKRNELISFINPHEKSFYISVAIEAELKSIAIRNKWQNKKMSALEGFLDDIQIIDINQFLIQTYVQIDTYSQRKNPNFTEYPFKTPRNMGKNDLWIASTASILGLELLTTDADFDHLHQVFLEVRKFCQEDFKGFV